MCACAIFVRYGVTSRGNNVWLHSAFLCHSSSCLLMKLSQYVSVLPSLFLVLIAVVILPSSALCSGTPRIAASPEQVCPALVGASIPSVEVSTPEGTAVNLQQVVQGKPTLLLVYRGGWCPYCNRHLTALMDIEQSLLSLGYQIIAISADRPEKLRESLGEHEWRYQLFSDSAATAAQALGLAFVVDDATVTRYEKYGIDLDKASGLPHHILPVPAAFIVNTSGIITFAYVNPNYKVRVDAELLLAAARASLKE